MPAFILRRVLSSILVVAAVTLVTFALLQATAGSWVPGLELNPNVRPEDITRIRSSLGLDQPPLVQYARWLGGVVRGDLGLSLINGSPVADHIAQRLPNTLTLALAALLLAIVTAVPLGVAGAVWRGTKIDSFLTVVAASGVSIPSFWFGLLLILALSVLPRVWGLPGLPSNGAVSAVQGGDLFDRLAHLVMPSVVLAFAYMAVWSRFVRSSVIEELAEDYVRTARSKGLIERRVLFVHVLRNALLPLVTLIGLEVPTLVGGAAVVEVVFGWPGIGRLALESALAADYTVVLGITTIAAVLVVAGNLIADISYGLLDPRIRLG